MQDGDFPLLRPSTSTPSLAQNARRRGFSSVGTLHYTTLPCSNCKSEGFPPINHLHPLTHLKRETEGMFLCRHTTITPPSPKLRDGGVSLLSTTSTPSLARNVRRRGCFLCRHTTTTPPSLKLRAEGFPSHQPPPPPHSLQTRDGGGVSSVGTTPPSLKLRAEGFPSHQSPPPPHSLKTRDGGGVSSVGTP